MTDFSGLVGKTFLATQISAGSVAASGTPGFFTFTEQNSLADQSAIIGTIGATATFTFTSVSVSGGFINFSAALVSTSLFGSGTVTGNFLGNDATDFILNAQGVPGRGSAFLFVTNTVGQQPGAGNSVNVNSNGTSNPAATNNPYTPPACFAEGTRIATTRGLVPVEALAVGDRVVIADGERDGRAATRPVVWIGHRRVDCAQHAQPWDVLPVRVHAGAFGAGCPERDLVLSPDHAVYVDGVLIPIRYLINGGTVTQDAVDAVSYWHVELDAHDVLLAEGMPAESYLDTGNRDAFANAPVAALRAEFAVRDQGAWTRHACAPLIEEGAVLDAVRSWLDERAGTRLPAAEMVMITGTGRLLVTLPAGTTRVRLVSATMRPDGERRRLGAAIGGISLDGVAVALDGPVLAAGFHGCEADWRWTNGEGVLLVEPQDRARSLVVTVAMVAPAVLSAA